MGITGVDGPAGSAGNAIVFDTDATVNSDTGSNSKSDLVRQFRGVDDLLNNDVYWHIQTGRVFQYQGVSLIDSTADATFTEITTNTGGFLALDGIRNTATTGERIIFEDDNIQIHDGTRVRVRIGNLT